MTTIRSNGGCMNDYRRLICFVVRRRVVVLYELSGARVFCPPTKFVGWGWCRWILVNTGLERRFVSSYVHRRTNQYQNSIPVR